MIKRSSSGLSSIKTDETHPHTQLKHHSSPEKLSSVDLFELNFIISTWLGKKFEGFNNIRLGFFF